MRTLGVQKSLGVLILLGFCDHLPLALKRSRLGGTLYQEASLDSGRPRRCPAGSALSHAPCRTARPLLAGLAGLAPEGLVRLFHLA